MASQRYAGRKPRTTEAGRKLLAAVASGDLATLESAVKDHGLGVVWYLEDDEGKLATHIAALNGRLNVLYLLLPEPFHAGGPSGATALQQDNARQLLRPGPVGWTAFHFAAHAGHSDCIEFMATRADSSSALLVRDQRGRSALDIACRLGNVRSCHAIWGAAAELEIKARSDETSNGYTAATGGGVAPQQALAGSMAVGAADGQRSLAQGPSSSSRSPASAAKTATMAIDEIIGTKFPPLPPRLPPPPRAPGQKAAESERAASGTEPAPGGTPSPAAARARYRWEAQHARLVLSQDAGGLTPAHHSCLTAQLHALQWCAAAAALPLGTAARGGATPAMLLSQAPSASKPAVAARCPAVMRWLLSPAGGGQAAGGAAAVDAQGASALHMACASATRALAALAQASAKSPAARAAETAAAGASALVLLLLRAGADPDLQDSRGNSPRSLAEAGPRLPGSARLRLGDAADGVEDVLGAILGGPPGAEQQGEGYEGADGEGGAGGTPALLDDGGSSRDGASTAGSVGTGRSGHLGASAAVASGVPGPVELLRQRDLPPGPPSPPTLKREDGDGKAGGIGGTTADSTAFAVSPGGVELQWGLPAPLGPACVHVSGYEIEWRTVGRVLRSAGSKAGAPQFALRPEKPSAWTRGGAPLGAAGAAWSAQSYLPGAAGGYEGATRGRSGSYSPASALSGGAGQEDEDCMQAVAPPESFAACVARLGPLANGQAYQVRVRAVDERGRAGDWSSHEAPPSMTVLAGGGSGSSDGGAASGGGASGADGARQTGLVVLCAEGAEPAGTEATARLVQGGMEASGSLHVATLWPLAAAAAASGDSDALRSLCNATRSFAWALPSRHAAEPFASAGSMLAPTRALLALPSPAHLPGLAYLARPAWLSRAFRGLPLGEGSRRSPLHAAAGAGRWCECATLAKSLLPAGASTVSRQLMISASGGATSQMQRTESVSAPTIAEVSQAAVLLMRALAARDARGATPMLLAAARGHARSLLVLLTLASAAEADLSQAQILPEAPLAAIINYGDARGFTPLHCCAMRASHGEFGAAAVDTKGLVVTSGSDSKGDLDGAGVALPAVPWTLMFRLLLEAGADPQARAVDGRSAVDVLVAARSSPRYAAREASAALAALAGNAGAPPASPMAPPAVERVLAADRDAASASQAPGAMLSESESRRSAKGLGAVIVAVAPPTMRAGARAATGCEVALFALPRKHSTQHPSAIPWRVIEAGSSGLGLGSAIATGPDGEMLPPEARHTVSSGPFGGEANLRASLVVRARWSAAVGATASRLAAMPASLAVHESMVHPIENPAGASSGAGEGVSAAKESPQGGGAPAEEPSSRALAVLLPLPKHPDGHGIREAPGSAPGTMPCLWALSARWVDASGRKGPWSPVASARITAADDPETVETSGVSSDAAGPTLTASLVRAVGAGTRSSPVPSACDLAPVDLSAAIDGTRVALDRIMGRGEGSRELRRDAYAAAIAFPYVLEACEEAGRPLQLASAASLGRTWARSLAEEGVPLPPRLGAETAEACKAMPWLGWAACRAAGQAESWEVGGVPRQRAALQAASRNGSAPAAAQCGVEAAFRLPVRMLCGVLPAHAVACISGEARTPGAKSGAETEAASPGTVPLPARLVGSAARQRLNDRMKAMTHGVAKWRDAVLLSAALTGGGDGTPVWLCARTLATHYQGVADGEGRVSGANVPPESLQVGEDAVLDRGTALAWLREALADAGLAVGAAASVGAEGACRWFVGLSQGDETGPTDALDCLTLGPFLVRASARRLAQRAGMLGVAAEVSRAAHGRAEAQRKAEAKAKAEEARRAAAAAKAAAAAHDEEEDLLAAPVASGGGGGAQVADPFAGLAPAAGPSKTPETTVPSKVSAGVGDDGVEESPAAMISKIDGKAWADARRWRAAAAVRVLARGLDEKAIGGVAPRARLAAGGGEVDREWLARCLGCAASVAQASAPALAELRAEINGEDGEGQQGGQVGPLSAAAAEAPVSLVSPLARAASRVVAELVEVCSDAGAGSAGSRGKGLSAEGGSLVAHRMVVPRGLAGHHRRTHVSREEDEAAVCARAAALGGGLGPLLGVGNGAASDKTESRVESALMAAAAAGDVACAAAALAATLRAASDDKASDSASPAASAGAEMTARGRAAELAAGGVARCVCSALGQEGASRGAHGEGAMLRRARAHLATLAGLLFSGDGCIALQALTGCLRMSAVALCRAARAEAAGDSPMGAVACRVALASCLIVGVSAASTTEGHGLAGAPEVLSDAVGSGYAGASGPSSGAGSDASPAVSAGNGHTGELGGSSHAAAASPAVLLALAARASDSVAYALRLLLEPLPAPEGMMAYMQPAQTVESIPGKGAAGREIASKTTAGLLLAIRQPAIALPPALVAAAHEAARALGTACAGASSMNLAWWPKGSGLGRRAAAGAVLEAVRASSPWLEIDGEAVARNPGGQEEFRRLSVSYYRAVLAAGSAANRTRDLTATLAIERASAGQLVGIRVRARFSGPGGHGAWSSVFKLQFERN